MKKKVLSFLIILSVMFGVVYSIPLVANANVVASGVCGDNAYWSLDNEGNLTISGSGDMYGYRGKNRPWKDYKDNIKRVYIDYGITSVGDYAFLQIRDISYVSIANSVKSIGVSAFESTKISFINIPGSVTYVGDWAFASCINLSNVSWTDSITYIGEGAFAMCKKLKSIYLPEHITTINSYAFWYCIINTISLPGGLTCINDLAFADGDVKTINFRGTKTEWDNVSFGKYNDGLIYSDVYYGINNIIPVYGLSINIPKKDLKVGESTRAAAACTPKSATGKSLTWSSDNPKVATVNPNGVVTACGVGIANITVKSKNGKSAKCTITVQAQNAIEYDNFRYAFGNSDSSFGYDNYWFGYKIPYERYMQLGFEKAKAKTMVKGWGGNCFGMSASSILFYKNILHEERYNENVHTPIEFKAPNAGNNAFLSDKWEVKLRHMIELMQVSQVIYSDFINDIKYIEDFIKTEIDNGKPLLLVLNGYKKNNKNEKGGHAVVIYDYDYSDIGMRLYIYDCSGFVDSALYQEESTDLAFHYLTDTWVWSFCCIISYESILEKYEYIYKLKDNATSLFSLIDEPTYTYIMRPAEDMIITNSSGQISQIIDGEISGEIENIRVVLDSYLVAKPKYTIIAPTDTYTIVGSGDEVITTSFADDYMSSSVTAKSSTPITISSDLREIDVNTTTGEEYGITYTVYDNIFDEMNLSGTATGTITSTFNDADITITGVNTLTASASVSDSVVSANSDSLSNNDKITVKCEEVDSGATIQILSADAELTDKTSLPERLTVDSPTYDLASGTYKEGQILNFTKDDETVIYYTTDGSIPSADNGIIYSLPIDINKTMTVKAISTKYGYLDSKIVELNYTLPEVDIPQANFETGTYDKVITVELSTGSYEDAIYYTLDGSNPLESGILYTVPINISEDAYLQAYTLRDGCISEISEYEYTVAPTYPFYFSNSLTNQDGEIITPDNLADITKVKMTLSRLHTGDHTGTFLIAFYGADNRLIYINSKKATIGKDIDEVEIDITEDVSSAYKVKAFAWKDSSSMQPICESLEESIINK